ncbi:hypothetical protein MSBRW_1298 [Methanosarcina barkeri str. Wiesmoor]|uniref:Uncharacterized protein n=1 Tax=Methanosarcina barkeri str. Wiesmoor TaxID=1434109 RepID=A0A0E3LL29_METBA|nr:hypothetical protein [Methanosarcina barkeri]AKB50551.1 hypothetical protein MSBRW_1298 [Methanosarcina barkeri str. Wiesmoor]
MAAPSGIRDFSMSVPTANSAIRIFIGKEKLGNLFITFCSNPFEKLLERNPFQKLLERNPFQKRLDRKTRKTA